MDQLIRDQQPLGESRPRGPVCGLSVNSVSLSALSPLLSPPHLAPCLVPAGGSVACHPESARGASLGQWGDNGQSPTQQESRGWGVYSHRRLGAGRDQRPWPRDDGDVHAAQGESTARAPGEQRGQVPGAPRLLRASLFLLFFSFLNLVTRRNLPLRLRLDRSSITFCGGSEKRQASDPDLPRPQPHPDRGGARLRKMHCSEFLSWRKGNESD